MTLAMETLSQCIGDVDGIRKAILPKNGNRRHRMSRFLRFILQDDNNVIVFEKMLAKNGLVKVLKKKENEKRKNMSSEYIGML